MRRREEIRTILRLGIPMALTQMLMMSTLVVDNMMVGRIGTKELAALGISATYYSFLFIIAIGILTATNPLVSHALGARRLKEIPTIVHHGVVAALLCGLFMGVFMWISPAILLFLKQDPELVAIGYEYLKALLWGIPGVMAFILLRQYFDATGFPTPAVILMFLGFLINVPLDYALIYGVYGFPKLGVAGAGIATSIVNLFVGFGLLAYTRYHRHFKDFSIWIKPEWNPRILREIFRLGVPMAGGMFMEVGFFTGTVWLAGIIGTTQLAAHQIALNVASFSFMIPLGLSFAVCVRVGQFAGAGDLQGSRLSGHLGFTLAIVIGLLSAALLTLLAPQIASLYTTEPITHDLAVILLRTAAIFQVFDGLQVMGFHSLRGLKDTKVPFFNTVIAFWIVGLTLSIFLAFRTSLGVQGLWMGMIASLTIAAILHLRRFRTLAR